MEKIKLNLDNLIKAYNGVCHLLTMAGIDRKKVYWLGRNRDALKSKIDIWYKHRLLDIRAKYEIDIPTISFIPITKYQEFKKELLATKWIDEDLDFVFEKYEIISDAQKGISVEKQKEFEAELRKAFDEFEQEIEYTKITVDNAFEKALQQLQGEYQLALAFMLEEESPIKIVQELMI